MVCFDPLDGSSNIDCLAPIGTIFAIYKRVCVFVDVMSSLTLTGVTYVVHQLNLIKIFQYNVYSCVQKTEHIKIERFMSNLYQRHTSTYINKNNITKYL